MLSFVMSQAVMHNSHERDTQRRLPSVIDNSKDIYMSACAGEEISLYPNKIIIYVNSAAYPGNSSDHYLTTKLLTE